MAKNLKFQLDTILLQTLYTYTQNEFVFLLYHYLKHSYIYIYIYIYKKIKQMNILILQLASNFLDAYECINLLYISKFYRKYLRMNPKF